MTGGERRPRVFQEEVEERIRVLRSALGSLRSGLVGAGDSVRRMARSIGHTAADYGLQEIRDLSDHLQDTEALDELASRAEVLLGRLEGSPALSAPRIENILIIEDEPVSAFLLESVLSADGRRITISETAAEAEWLTENAAYDLVLLDLFLPDADGRDFLLKLRERAPTAETPVIVCSARPADQARPECLALGAQGYLEKPVKPEVARSLVDRLLRQPSHPDREIDTVRGPDLANRAVLSEAFRAARASGADSGVALSLASIAIGCSAAGGEAGGAEAGPWTVGEISASIRSVLRESDLLASGPKGGMLVLFPGTAPEEAARILQSALDARATERGQAPPAAGDSPTAFRAGVAEVSKSPNLEDAVARAERMLFLGRSSGMPGVIHWEEGPIPARGKILLVEDDQVTARLIRHRLEKDGFDVVHFEDGGAAYEACAGERASLAIFDVKVPGMDGFELLQRVRGLPNFTGVPIIMLTSMGGEEDIVRGFKLGASDYVLKPFSPVELVARIHRLLDR